MPPPAERSPAAARPPSSRDRDGALLLPALHVGRPRYRERGTGSSRGLPVWSVSSLPRHPAWFLILLLQKVFLSAGDSPSEAARLTLTRFGALPGSGGGHRAADLGLRAQLGPRKPPASSSQHHQFTYLNIKNLGLPTGLSSSSPPSLGNLLLWPYVVAPSWPCWGQRADSRAESLFPPHSSALLLGTRWSRVCLQKMQFKTCCPKSFRPRFCLLPACMCVSVSADLPALSSRPPEADGCLQKSLPWMLLPGLSASPILFLPPLHPPEDWRPSRGSRVLGGSPAASEAAAIST